MFLRHEMHTASAGLLAEPGKYGMMRRKSCGARAPFTAQRAESYWPGEGSAPLEELLRSVRATGYDGPCSVEVMDPNVLALPAEEAIRRAAETMKPLLARVER